MTGVIGSYIGPSPGCFAATLSPNGRGLEFRAWRGRALTAPLDFLILAAVPPLAGLLTAPSNLHRPMLRRP